MTCRNAALESRITPPRTLSPPRLPPLSCFDNRRNSQYILLIVTYTVCSDKLLTRKQGALELDTDIEALSNHVALPVTKRLAFHVPGYLTVLVPYGRLWRRGTSTADLHPAPCRVVQWTLVVTEEEGAGCQRSAEPAVGQSKYIRRRSSYEGLHQ